MNGQLVCWTHGGAAKQNRRAAARRLAEAKAAKSLAEHEVTPLGEPLEAFRDLAAEVVAFKEYTGALVAELKGSLTGLDVQGREDVRAKVALYERALDRAGRMLAEYARLNVDERLTRIAEAESTLLLTVVEVWCQWLYPVDDLTFALELMQHAIAAAGSDSDVRRLRRLKPPAAVREQLDAVHARWRDAAEVEQIRARSEEQAIASVLRQEAEIEKRVEVEVARRLAQPGRQVAGPRTLEIEAGS